MTRGNGSRTHLVRRVQRLTKHQVTKLSGAIAIALLALAGCGGPGRVVQVQASSARGGVAVDFELLATYWIDIGMQQPVSVQDQLRESRIVSDDASLLQAWQRFWLPGSAPQVDFSKQQVLFLATRESVICGVLPITGAALSADNQLLLRVPRSYACASLNRLLHLYLRTVPERPLVVRVIGIPRLAHAQDRILFGWSETSELPARAAKPLAAPVESSDRTVTLPARGYMELVALGDGTRVWVAQHADGAISVLAGDFALPHWAVGNSLAELQRSRRDDYSLPTVWQPRAGCFNALFDAWGRPLFRAMPSLDHYAFSSDPEHAERITIGRRISGTQGEVAATHCVPADEHVYSAYPRSKPGNAPGWFFSHESGTTPRAIATGIEFPFEYPHGPRKATTE